VESLTTALLAAFAISLGWAAVSIWLGPAVGWVDLPERQGKLSVHDRPAVPLGGVGIFLGVHTALAILDIYDVGLAIATGIVLLLGLADDKLDLDPKLRLVVEFVAGAVLVTIGDVGVSGWWGIAVGTALVVVAINAVNLFDGLDGLVASTTIVTALGLAWLADLRGFDAGFGLVLAAAMAGFLVLNWNPAKVFLGDNGAYTVATLIAFGILQVPFSDGAVAAGGPPTSMAPIAVWIAMGMLGVFVLDLAVTFMRRQLNGRPLFQGDRSHVYDQLRDRGMGVKQVALSAAGGQAAIVLVVIAVDQWIGGIGAVLMLLVVVAVVLTAARSRGFLKVDA
jgi:UDP-GlcNAc:undecaprenyl-phosphate GlcNAc-1-phosphate transferase